MKLLAAALVVAAAAPQVGSWRREPSMRNTRSAHAVVATADAVYALGGAGRGGPVLEVERFDGAAWAPEATLPQGLNAPAAVALDGRIYVIGGFDGLSNVPTDRVRVYDLATKTWRDAAPLPAARGGHAAVVFRGRIHVLGGGNELRTLNDHDVYDPATNTWTRLGPLSRSKGSPAAVVFGNKIYAIGGRSGRADYGDVEIYNAATNRWSRGPRIPPRGTVGAAVYRGAVYVFGGESQATARTLNDVLRLNTRRRRWERVSRLPTARNYARAVVFRDAVYVVGGSREAGASHSAVGTAVVERYFVRR